MGRGGECRRFNAAFLHERHSVALICHYTAEWIYSINILAFYYCTVLWERNCKLHGSLMVN